MSAPRSGKSRCGLDGSLNPSLVATRDCWCPQISIVPSPSSHGIRMCSIPAACVLLLLLVAYRIPNGGKQVGPLKPLTTRPVLLGSHPTRPQLRATFAVQHIFITKKCPYVRHALYVEFQGDNRGSYMKSFLMPSTITGAAAVLG